MPATSSQLATSGATPMLFAADRSDVPLMRLLVELGADPLLPNGNNTTPLMAAAGVGTKEGHEEAGEENEALEAVEMLLDRGADLNGVDTNGDTAMHGAAAAAQLTRNLVLDWGLKGLDPTDPTGLAVTPGDQRDGWRYAHWLVSHAQDHGVKRVRFGDLEWTARNGTWDRVTGQQSPAGQVVAEVFNEG